MLTAEAVKRVTLRARVRRRREERGHRAAISLPGATLESVSAARRLVSTCGKAWALPSDALDDLVQITSELAANAIDHSPGPRLTVVIGLADGAATVSVTDCGPVRALRASTAADDDERGRGLAVVGALAEQWGQTPLTAGNCVWARVSLAPEPAPARDGDGSVPWTGVEL